MNVCAVRLQARSVHTYIGAINIVELAQATQLCTDWYAALSTIFYVFYVFFQVLSQSSIVFSILEEQRIYVSLSGGDQFMMRSDTVAKVLLINFMIYFQRPHILVQGMSPNRPKFRTKKQFLPLASSKNVGY